MSVDKGKALEHYRGLAAQAAADPIPVGEATDSGFGEFADACLATGTPVPASDVFGSVLGRFVSMAPVIGGATVVRPRLGRRHGRCFSTERDALAYEDGFVAYRHGELCPWTAGSPAWRGWYDAAADWDAGEDARSDATRECDDERDRG